MPEPGISVIIPAYNSAKTIRKTLEAIANQEVSSQIETFVVDDGSTDQTPLIVKTFAQVRYLHQVNQGPAAARNLGATSAHGDYLFFTDSDCVPEQGWIKKMVPYFEDPKIAVVAGSYGIANPENRIARCIHQEILYRHRRMPQTPSCFGSFNFAIRREIFNEVGGFDVSYRHASGEDNDLSYKIIAKGYRIYFAKDALVDHFHTERLGRYLKEQYRHGFWRVKMYVAHPAMSRGDDYTFWKDIVEVPLSLLLIIPPLFFFIYPPVMGFVGGIAAFMLSMEICYGLIITGNFSLGLFWAAVMFARAFARSSGFLAGGCSFSPLSIFSSKFRRNWLSKPS